jgi:phage recombination protein Bet
MEQNSNAVATVTEQSQITAKLLNDYLNTITDKLTNAQRDQFIAVASAFGLNPFKREIYATTYKNKDGGTVMSIVTGYEVYLKRAEMNPNYNGFETAFGTANGDMSCTCKVYRKDRTMPVTSTVWMKEYNTNRSLWASKPRMMLEKVAIATAFRRAFPMDFGGMPYTNDELPEHMTGADKLEQQGYTEVQQAAPVAQVEQPKAAKTQDEKDANWIAMCDELRERNPEIFDNYLKQHNVPDLAEIKGSKDRHKLYTDIKATIDFAEKEADNG